MKVVRAILISIGIAIGSVVAAVASISLVARFGDGPLGPFPGGALVEGQLVEAPVSDWTFAESVMEVEVQLLEPARSRTTWIMVHEGRAYIPCGIPDFRLWKQWPHQARADGRAIVRVEDRRYRVDLNPLDEPALEEVLRAELTRKYPSFEGMTGDLWLFRLEPASSG